MLLNLGRDSLGGHFVIGGKPACRGSPLAIGAQGEEKVMQLGRLDVCLDLAVGVLGLEEKIFGEKDLEAIAQQSGAAHVVAHSERKHPAWMGGMGKQIAEILLIAIPPSFSKGGGGEAEGARKVESVLEPAGSPPRSVLEPKCGMGLFSSLEIALISQR